MSATTMERSRVDGSALFAARWREFERVASELVADARAEHYRRTADVHERWSVKDAEANKPDDARHNHQVAAACRERVELIRRYPETFTDTLEVLADIFAEGQVTRDDKTE